MEGEAFHVEQRRRKLDVEGVCAFIFILLRDKDRNFLAMQRKVGGGGAGLILGHLAPVKLLLMIRPILKSAFLGNT